MEYKIVMLVEEKTYKYQEIGSILQTNNPIIPGFVPYSKQLHPGLNLTNVKRVALLLQMLVSHVKMMVIAKLQKQDTILYKLLQVG